MAHLRRGGSRIQIPRRQTSWSPGPKSETNGGAAAQLTATGSALGAIIAVPGSDGLTLVRLRGEFLFRLDTAVGLGDGFFGAVGVGIFNDAALTVGGVTSLQTPITNEDWDGWLWHQYFAVTAADAIVAAAAANAPGQSHNVTAAVRVVVDSKAMRKVPVGQSIAVVLQVTEVPTATATWFFNSRTLAKLP